MTHKDIRNHIYLTLARFYEKDSMYRNQYKQFSFGPSDNSKAQMILEEMIRQNIVEQRRPGVVRLTDFGYKMIQPDLEKDHLMHVIKESLNEIYMFDSDTLKFTYVNEGALSNIGYSMDKMTTMTPLDIKPEYDLQSFYELIEPLKRKNKKKVVFETVHKRADGSLYPVEVHLQLTQRVSKTVFVAIILDITDRRKSESEKEHWMHVIGESLNEIYMFDSESLKFTYLNDGALINIGYSMEEMATMTPLDIKPEYDLQSFHELIEPLKRKNKKKVVFETVHKRADGSLYPVEVHLQLSQHGLKSEFVAIILDITDRKKGQNEREQLIRELTRHNKDLRQFSYITSHNLRAPISNLTSLIYLLDNIPNVNADLQEILDDFKSSTRQLENTVEDLTKILVIRDNPSIEKEEISFLEVFEDVMSQSKYLTEDFKPRIVSDFKEAPTVTYNKTYLESILLNLFTNSIKYRSPERKLNVTVTTKDEGNQILLEFKDNGIGLDVNKFKDKLFGLYQRFHNHSDSKGLGLYLVKSQVEALGGTIEAKSAVDKGMTILIRFKKA